jgi:lipocalin
VAATADWIRKNAKRGDVIADPERSAEVMVATRDFSRFRTPTDDGGLAVVADPSSASNFILARQPVAGRGALERIYPRLYEAGAPTLALEFEAGEYRIYRVEGAEQGR